MSYITKTEYYSDCPNCGAPRRSTGEICEFCGTSLIKGKQIVEMPGNGPSEEFFPEDAALPVVTGKLFETNKFVSWFCILFGGSFLAIPTILFLVFIAFSGVRESILETLLFTLFFVPFWVIGGVVLRFPVRTAIYKRKCAEQPEIRGTVRGYEPGNVKLNDRPVQNIRIKIYKNGLYTLLLLKTMQTTKPYAVGSTIVLKNYKDQYILVQ